METYFILFITVVMNVAYVNSNICRRAHGEYIISKNGELLNPNLCQLYNITTDNLGCPTKCTWLKGCSNMHHFPETDLCLLCMDENAEVTDEWQGLTLYNISRPQGGKLYEQINADECEYGKGCYNGGTCIDDVFSYTCLCPPLFTGSTCEETVPSGCAKFDKNIASGAYYVAVQDAQNKTIPIHVYCDMDTDGGGWTVFQRRQDGSVSFAQNWAVYKEGFGDLMGEFWLGNDPLAKMTAPPAKYSLRIEFESFDNETMFAKYANFGISDESDNYRLSILGSYVGTAGDMPDGKGMLYHNGMMFSTLDRDNDMINGSSCAEWDAGGGFWYNACDGVGANGGYRNTSGVDDTGIHWDAWGHNVVLKLFEMKFRPTDF